MPRVHQTDPDDVKVRAYSSMVLSVCCSRSLLYPHCAALTHYSTLTVLPSVSCSRCTALTDCALPVLPSVCCSHSLFYPHCAALTDCALTVKRKKYKVKKGVSVVNGTPSYEVMVNLKLGIKVRS